MKTTKTDKKVKPKEKAPVVDTHGGKREGAGRPTLDDKKKLRSMKIKDSDWEEIAEMAASEGLSYGDLFVKLVKEK